MTNTSVELARHALGGLREATAQSLQELQRAEGTGRAEIVGELTQRLQLERSEHPTVIGNADAVAFHHFGAELLDQRFETSLNLIEHRIHESAINGGRVPLLVRYAHEVDTGEELYFAEKTVLVFVDPAQTQSLFVSSISAKEEKMHAFTNETGLVDTLRLELRGDCYECNGKLGDKCIWSGVKTETFLMHERVTARGGKGSGMPSEYAFHNTEFTSIQELLLTPVEGWMAIGWREISNQIEGETMIRQLFEILKAANIPDRPPRGPRLHAQIALIEAFSHAAATPRDSVSG